MTPMIPLCGWKPHDKSIDRMRRHSTPQMVGFPQVIVTQWPGSSAPSIHSISMF